MAPIRREAELGHSGGRPSSLDLGHIFPPPCSNLPGGLNLLLSPSKQTKFGQVRPQLGGVRSSESGRVSTKLWLAAFRQFDSWLRRTSRERLWTGDKRGRGRPSQGYVRPKLGVLWLLLGGVQQVWASAKLWPGTFRLMRGRSWPCSRCSRPIFDWFRHAGGQVRKELDKACVGAGASVQ